MTSTSAGGEQQDYIGKNSMDSYEVKKVTAPVNWETDVPGSKSTLTGHVLAALCREAGAAAGRSVQLMDSDIF